MDWLIMTAINYAKLPITWFFFATGAVIGSFLNVCILRIPEGTFWAHARSVCPACKSPIPFYLNVPILSFLWLRGRSRCCKQSLSMLYPTIEVLTGALFVLLYWKFPFIDLSGSSLQIQPDQWIRWLHSAVLTSVLVVCSAIDFRLMIIPDVISLPMIAVVPGVVFLHPELDWFSALAGVLAGGGSLYLVAWIYWVWKRKAGLGMGDVKLLAFIGGWLGYQAIFPTILVGSVLGAMVGLVLLLRSSGFTLKSALPFGPFLAIGAWIQLIAGQWLQIWIGG